MKREVAAKAGNFRGVCPLNGRKDPLTARGAGFACTEFAGQNPDRKVRFCKRSPETHETVFKGNAPLKNVCRAERYLLYTRHAHTACACSEQNVRPATTDAI